MTALHAVLARKRASEAGLTLVELLVAMVLAIVLVTISLTVVLNSQDAVFTTKKLQDLNEEARQAINRMARDIRQANRVVTAVNPDGPLFSPSPSAVTAVRFESDFDGDGCIGGAVPVGLNPAPTCLAYNPANPEDLTYCFEASSKQLYVIDNKNLATPISATSTNCVGGQPLLAGNVGAFKIEYRSNQYRHDLNPSDGVTTWRELDEAALPVGDQDGKLGVELKDVDSVILNVTMRSGSRRQDYRTQVDLRNTSR